MAKYFEYLTRVPTEEYKDLIAHHPRDAKIRLAKEILRDFHSEQDAEREAQNFIAQFSQKQIPDASEIKEQIAIPSNGEAFYKTLVENKILSSNSEARRMFEAGSVAVEVDGLKPEAAKGRTPKNEMIKLSLEDSNVMLNSGARVKVGKKRWVLLK